VVGARTQADLDEVVARIEAAGRRGLAVVTDVLGGVATKGLEVVLTDENLRRMFEDNTPMRRPGQPEDIACTALYFASPACSWVTGKILQVDGGTERPSIDVPAAPLRAR